MKIEERARLAHGKKAFVVALCVEYYPMGGNDTTRAQIYKAVSEAINEAVAPFGTVAALKVTSV